MLICCEPQSILAHIRCFRYPNILKSPVIYPYLGCCENMARVFVTYWISYHPKVLSYNELPNKIWYYALFLGLTSHIHPYQGDPCFHWLSIWFHFDIKYFLTFLAYCIGVNFLEIVHHLQLVSYSILDLL